MRNESITRLKCTYYKKLEILLSNFITTNTCFSHSSNSNVSIVYHLRFVRMKFSFVIQYLGRLLSVSLDTFYSSVRLIMSKHKETSSFFYYFLTDLTTQQTTKTSQNNKHKIKLSEQNFA